MTIRDDILDEIDLLERSMEASQRTINGAGLLFIPDGMVTDPPVMDEKDFEEELIKAMTEPISKDAVSKYCCEFVLRNPPAEYITFHRDTTDTMEQCQKRIETLKNLLVELDK